MKKIKFTMSVIYDKEETYAENALYAIEHEMCNIEGIKDWEVTEISEWGVEWKENDE